MSVPIPRAVVDAGNGRIRPDAAGEASDPIRPGAAAADSDPIRRGVGSDPIRQAAAAVVVGADVPVSRLRSVSNRQH